jgi:hypothetical protein
LGLNVVGISLCVLGVFAVAYQLFVSRLVVLSVTLSGGQKIAQLLIWLAPGIGAFFAHWGVRSEKAAMTNDRNFIPEDHTYTGW